ncbi:MAG TPA: HYR domain-containing protein [Gaiellaceae bacterium]|jgi:hypothetical protein
MDSWRLPALLLAVVTAGAIASAAQGDAAVLSKPTISTQTTTWTQETDATFEFSADPGISFICRLDGAVWNACSSPTSYSSLAEGTHSFQVRQTDLADATSPPSGLDWTIDLTPPDTPADMTVEATSPLGASVTFAAADNLDPAPELSCTPPSGSTFPLGTTGVSCTATDAAGNVSPSGTFSVTVQDTTPPTLAPHADVIAPQESAAGAQVAYEAPAVSDAADASPSVDCVPASGTVFALGDTPVACTATDASGNTSSELDFTVTVQQGPTPPQPTLAADVPPLTNRTDASFDFSVEEGATVECRLDGPLGPGSFGPCATTTSQSYTGLTEGAYLFTVQATNGIGNVAQATYSWTVDVTPPAPVAGFRARGGDGRVWLRWTMPIDLDYERVRIWRQRVGATSWKLLAERVTATSLTDRAVRNDVRYRYAIRSVDEAHNASAAAETTARPSKIFLPQFDALLDSPPLIDWTSVSTATYYNLQVWRNGRKILSRWPLLSRFRMRSSWSYRGKTYSLSAGRYIVYVWPGFGSKAAANYGRLLGWTAFRIE